MLRKLDDRRHELAIARDRGGWETVACETRSYLTHDLLHYAVEAEAGVRQSLGIALPSWLDDAFVLAVHERMRHLVGRWKATAYGGAMELTWPDPGDPGG